MIIWLFCPKLPQKWYRSRIIKYPHCFLVKMLTGNSCFTFYSTEFSCHYKNHSFLLLSKEVALYPLSPALMPPGLSSLPSGPLPPALRTWSIYLFLPSSLVYTGHILSYFYISNHIFFIITMLFNSSTYRKDLRWLKRCKQLIVWARSDSLYVEKGASWRVKKLRTSSPLLEIY